MKKYSIIFRLLISVFLIQACWVFAYEPNSPDFKDAERSRIEEHLSLVHRNFLNIPEGLTEEQATNRGMALKHLKEYISNGVFPVNNSDMRIPIFRDSNGTWCAVGYLLVATGYGELAESISASDNQIYVDEINDFSNTKLGDWADLFGFNRAELALIQPSYGGGGFMGMSRAGRKLFPPENTNQPVVTSPDQPEAASPDQPVATSPDQSVATSPDQSVATSPDQPEATSSDQPEAASPDQPVATSLDQPEATSLDQPEATSPDKSPSKDQDKQKLITVQPSQNRLSPSEFCTIL